MTRVSGEDLYDSLAATKEPDHDTLYCSPSHYDRLVREASQGLVHRRVTGELKIAGLEIIKFEQIERPIVCEKGEVFPLAKDFKNED